MAPSGECLRGEGQTWLSLLSGVTVEAISLLSCVTGCCCNACKVERYVLTVIKIIIHIISYCNTDSQSLKTELHAKQQC